METHSNPERRGILLMLLSVVLFTANVLLLRAIKDAEPAANEWVATAIRGVVGWIVVHALFRRRGFEPGRLVRSPMLLIRGAVGAAGILLFYVTIEPLGTGRAVILNLTYPIFGAVIAFVWLRESLSMRQLSWMVAALAGLGVFFAGRAFQGGVSIYEFMALAGAVVSGVTVVLIRILRNSEHSSTIYASQCVWCIVAALPLAYEPLLRLPTLLVLGLVLAGVVVAGGQLALTESFHSLSVAKGSSIQTLMPVATSVGGMMLFGETYTGIEVLGAALTLVATWRVVSLPAVRLPVLKCAQ